MPLCQREDRGGQHNSWNCIEACVAADPIEQLEAGHFGHREVEEQDIRRLVQELRPALASGRGRADIVETARQQLANQVSCHFFIIDQQYAGYRSVAGQPINLGNLAATDWTETLADLKQLSSGSIFDYWCSRRASQVSSRHRSDLQ